MLFLRWTSRRADGSEYTIVNGPVQLGDDRTIAISITVPNLFGGSVRTDFLMVVDSTETMTLTHEPDPPDADADAD